MRKFFLITNCSGLKYWSYLGHRFNTDGMLAEAVAKYGDIYINRNGGWMPKSAAITIHATVEQDEFPPEA